MSHFTHWVATALLIGGIAACEPGDEALARWQGHCLDAADAIALSDRSRNGIAIGCEAALLERRAER